MFVRYLKHSIRDIDQEFFISLGGSIVFKVMATALSFASSVLVARVLGIGAFGVFTFSLALVNVVSILTRLGIPTVVMKHVARYQASEQYELFKGIMIGAHVLAIALALLVSGLFVLVLNVFPIVDDKYIDALLWAIPLLWMSPLTALRTGVLQGLGKVALSTLPESVIKPAVFLCIMSFFLLIGDQASAPVAVTVEVVSMGIALAAGYLLYWKYRPKVLSSTTPVFQVRHWLSETRHFIFLGGAMLFLQSTDVIMLGLISTETEVGAYRVAFSLAAFVSLVFGMASSVLAPRMSALAANNNYQAVEVFGRKVLILVSMTALPVMALLFFLGNTVLAYLYGPAFLIASDALKWLVLAQGVTILFGFSVITLNMSDHQHISARIYMVSAVLNIVLNLVLIPQFGASGAALATASAMILTSALAWYFSLQKLSINTSLLGSLKNNIS